MAVVTGILEPTVRKEVECVGIAHAVSYLDVDRYFQFLSQHPKTQSLPS